MTPRGIVILGNPGRAPDLARRALILAAVAEHGGNVRAAARSLGMLTSTLRSALLRIRSPPKVRRRVDPVTAMLPRSMRARVTLRLIEDGRPGLIQRRRADCARLSACEAEWIEVHRGADTNARCPVRCQHFKRRTT